MNKVGGRVRALRGISFQNLLGISLLLGGMNSNFPGGTGLDSPGENLNCIGEVTPLNVRYTAGEQSLGQDCRGCLLGMHVYCWGMLRSAGVTNFLKAVGSFARRECINLLTHSLGN